MSSTDSPVFYDPAGRRWKRVRRIWMAFAIVVTSLAAVLIVSVLVNPALPSFSIRPLASLPHTADIKPKALPAPANPSQQKAREAQAELQRALAATPRVWNTNEFYLCETCDLDLYGYPMRAGRPRFQQIT